ncbi:lysozyme g [Bombina bombina]|uniref:lysozyme g n=1 Tax=Bombina bombina TaxID=8345 RepID=UPI00235A4A58|nr:lysozyme g [Bombina bombina]
MFSVLLTVAALIGSATASGCYGNIQNVPTTGATCQTAKQDKLTYCGERASQRMAETDLRNMEKYKTIIKSVASKLCVDAALITGIISRETRAGAVLKNGWGDRGNGFGLMQVDKRYHTPRGQWNSETHISQATQILVDMIKGVGKKFPSWSTEQRLKGGIAAYNAGVGNIRNTDVDSRTTGKDYASDVIGRAKFFRGRGY